MTDISSLEETVDDGIGNSWLSAVDKDSPWNSAANPFLDLEEEEEEEETAGSGSWEGAGALICGGFGEVKKEKRLATDEEAIWMASAVSVLFPFSFSSLW